MMLETRTCVLCGPDAPRRVKYAANFTDDDLNAAIFSARRLPDRRHFRLVECQGCGLIYSDPACDPGLLARLYKESRVTYDRQEEQIYDCYAPILDRAVAGLPHRRAFVEIGGGSGFMLRYGRDHGFAGQIEVEPSADAERRFEANWEGAWFLRGMFTRASLPTESASLVCFFQVLDHIPDPRTFLSDVYAALQPGGAAVCVTHDTAALSARLLGERSPIFDIEHTYLFNRANLAALFRAVGFERVQAFPVANRYALRYWLHLFPLPPGIKPPAQRLLRGLGLAERRVSLRAGNCGVIAYKPLCEAARQSA